MQGSPARKAVLALCWLALGASACAGSLYTAYRQAHPEWDGAFPTDAADLERTVAQLYAPARNAVVSVMDVRIWRVASEDWQPIPVSELRTARVEPDADDVYAVYAALSCNSSDGVTRFARGAWVWYLLIDNRLQAYDHRSFRGGCVDLARFQPAHENGIALERDLLERLGIEKDSQFSTALQAYERGLAYAQAGRLPEAKQMLELGDRSPEKVWDSRLRYGADERELSASPKERIQLARDALLRQVEAQPAGRVD